MKLLRYFLMMSLTCAWASRAQQDDVMADFEHLAWQQNIQINYPTCGAFSVAAALEIGTEEREKTISGPLLYLLAQLAEPPGKNGNPCIAPLTGSEGRCLGATRFETLMRLTQTYGVPAVGAGFHQLVMGRKGPRFNFWSTPESELRKERLQFKEACLKLKIQGPSTSFYKFSRLINYNRPVMTALKHEDADVLKTPDDLEFLPEDPLPKRGGMWVKPKELMNSWKLLVGFGNVDYEDPRPEAQDRFVINWLSSQIYHPTSRLPDRQNILYQQKHAMVLFARHALAYRSHSREVYFVANPMAPHAQFIRDVDFQNFDIIEAVKVYGAEQVKNPKSYSTYMTACNNPQFKWIYEE